MDKLVERETTARKPLATAPAIAVQFFLIPLLVVGAMVLVYVGFRSLLTEDRSAEEYLTDIRSGGTNRRWPAAYELSRMMSDPEFAKKEQAVLAPELTKAFANSSDDDPRVRQYLALALGRLQPPIPPDAKQLLVEALNDKDSQTRISAIWALGSTGDATVAPEIERMYASDDAGVRKMVVYALGSLPGDAGVATLTRALDDEQPDVQWNAAVALARHGRHEGVPVLRRMLDREYVQRTVTRQQQTQDEIDPVGEVMISGLRAVAALKESTLSEPVKALSQHDTDLRVRQAALETLKAVG
ncbi:MAG TPA: HEAT repeat domain-containing protein [Vicinamibacterales bacterium]|nr:HEAT repeat domain-containing protein [Vicinamibacterales bacterium]